ncbi:MAG: ribosome maturation factor RimP [Coriobacteriia bacterium]
MSRVKDISGLLKPLVEEHGLEFVGVEVAGPSGNPILRVYLDREGGIDLDALAEANSWLSAALDEEPPFAGSYQLEVSSPGLDRPLFDPRDFERFAGREAVVRTVRPVDGRKRFSCTILGVEGDDVLIECDGTRLAIPFQDVAKANLKAVIDFDE